MDPLSFKLELLDASSELTGYVGSQQLSSGAVTADKIAAGAVTADKIANGTITSAKLAPGAGGMQIVTSTTRPASPSIGTMIFETDTNYIRVFTSEGWSTGMRQSASFTAEYMVVVETLAVVHFDALAVVVMPVLVCK